MNKNYHVDLDTLVNVISTIPSNIFFKDVDLKYVFSSHIWEQIDNGNDENFDIYGKSDRDVRKDKTNLDNAEKSDREIIETGIGKHYTIKSEVDGHQQYLDITKEPVKDENGNIIGIVGLINDVTQVSEEIQKQYEANIKEAERVSKMKSDFLTNTSHEIRTPLNAILGMNDIILREFDDEKLIEYATNIKNAGNTLLSLINDLLDFSKIEAGKLDIIPDNFYFEELINSLVNMIRIKADNKGLLFILDIDPNIPCELFGDEKRIEQILTNLLANAVKYTEKGSITLKIKMLKNESNKCKLIYEVIDTGIGIKEEDIKNLTDSFTRLEEQRNKNIEGTGLGITISDRLLKQMKSELVVQSVYGKGSTFGFELEHRVINNTPYTKYEIVTKDDVDSENFEAPNAHILIVDDVEMNLTVAKGLLKNLNMKMDTALNGKTAIEMCKNKKYDLILMDHMMPEMDGAQTMHRIREEVDGYKNVPIIVLTANAVTEAKEKMMNEGFDDFVSKPIDVKAISLVIKKWLPKNLIVNNQTVIAKIQEVKTEDDMKEYIDEEKALAYLGDKSLFMSLLDSFYETIDESLFEFKSYLDVNDFQNFKIKVHGLKNVARSLSADNLADKAYELEQLSDTQDKEIIMKKFDLFEKHFLGLKDKLKIMLKK